MGDSGNSESPLSHESAHQPIPEGSSGTFDAVYATEELVNAIIMHEYPLSIVDHLGFRRFSAALQPLFQVPSRDMIKKEIFKVYDFEKSIVSMFLDNFNGRVAITSNMWSSSNKKRGYMAVTAHYIDSSWTLQRHFLRFIYVPVPYSSDTLCNVLVECLMEWGIDTKLSTITLDNCSMNDAMVEKIKDKLPLTTLLRDGSLFHMHCCADILNLMVKDGLEVVKDEVEKIRDSVAYWTATSKRKEKFEETAKQLRIPCTNNLVLDCLTRWNSTYKMLEIAISYEAVFMRLKQRESQYTCFPTNSQWQIAKDVCRRLKLFNTIAEMISGTKYPTANKYFPMICEIKMAISQWINSTNELIQKMAKKMLAKFDRYWNVVHDVMVIASVLDPRYKMEMLEYYYEKLYEHNYVDQVRMIRTMCSDLVSDYHLKMNKDSLGSASLSLDSSNVGDDSLSEFDMYIMRKKRARISNIKTELDCYLEEDVFPRASDFDILLWWKLNGVNYPTLQAVAKDILAIPMSTIASESAFNTTGQILSPHRSQLHWTTLEALMGARSWKQNAERTACHNSKTVQEYANATLLNEMESDDEGEPLVCGRSSYFEDDQ